MNLGIETETIEFKKSTGELKEAVISICAILNKHHKGELYFGVKKDGVPVGQTVSEESLREVSQKIGNFIEPKIYPEIKKIVIDGRDCIHVNFEGNQTPYFAYGVARIRVADEDLALSPKELADFIRKNQIDENKWENRVSNRNVNDVDEDLLKQYVSNANEAGRLPIVYTDKKTVLHKLELTDGDRLLNAGKVLFSDDITQDIQMAIFATSERSTFLDIQRHHGPVSRLVDIAEAYINRNIHWKVEFDGSRRRKEIPELPLEAVREALLNSFCHKLYDSGQSNEVSIFRDRVEIYNPGTFPDGYVPKDFIELAERPVRRNPKIARILYYSKDIESFGTGLKRIADACGAAGVRYEFRMSKSGFVVIFYRDNAASFGESYASVKMGGDKAAVNGCKAAVNGSIATVDMDGLREEQKAIVNFTTERQRITNSEVQELLGIKKTRARELLLELVESHILQKHGKFKDSYYKLTY